MLLIALSTCPIVHMQLEANFFFFFLAVKLKLTSIMKLKVDKKYVYSSDLIFSFLWGGGGGVFVFKVLGLRCLCFQDTPFKVPLSFLAFQGSKFSHGTLLEL